MWEIGLPVLYALFLWWFLTGVVLYLGRRPRASHRWSMLAMTGILIASFAVLFETREITTPAGAALAFTAGLLIWGWHEMSFLMGYLVGSRTEPCPVEARGWDRFRLAFKAIDHHELAILATGIVVIALTWGATNQFGTWTFLILWTMRISAKFNVYLGVPNLAEEFLPEHLGYLKSYFRNRRINILFPVSITLGTLFAAALVHLAFSASAGGFGAVGFTLIATLSALAVIEHWLLVLPLPDAALWHWALPDGELRTKSPAKAGTVVAGGNVGPATPPSAPLVFEAADGHIAWHGASAPCSLRAPSGPMMTGAARAATPWR